MANDNIGDCVLAAIGHVIEMWTSLTSAQAVILPNPALIQAYTAITGYNPATGSPDPGTTIPQGLDFWQNQGMDGHHLMTYARIMPQDLRNIMLAVAFFGTCIVGLTVNEQIIQAFKRGDEWLNTYGAPTGFHCVPLIGYDSTSLECVTWASIQRMNWTFYNAYAVEAYIPIGPEWFRNNGLTPTGYDRQRLSQLLRGIKLSEVRV
jgi:hypothetical protein